MSGHEKQHAPYRIRPAAPEDMAEVVRLCHDHAVYERLSPPAPDVGERLASALFASPPRAWCLVVATGGGLVGYATYSLEFGTWQGREYVHMDCLYLDEPYRSRGIGAELMERIAAHGHELGAREMQWQTPTWNAGAIRFYERLRATGREKARFSLPLPVTPERGEAPG